MSGILDKLNKELEQFGRRAQAALDEGKLQLERMRLRREAGRGGATAGHAALSEDSGAGSRCSGVRRLLVKLDNLGTALARVDQDIAATKREEGPESESAETPAEPAARSD
jgi:hypothetical protein